jgi:hypothetical protein
LAVGEGDAAGEGLAAGLGFVAGGAVVSPAGEAVVVGDDVGLFEFEFVAGSQPTTNAIARIVGRRSAVRPISFIFGILIGLPRSSKIEKQDDNCPDAS